MHTIWASRPSSTDRFKPTIIAHFPHITVLGPKVSGAVLWPLPRRRSRLNWAHGLTVPRGSKYGICNSWTEARSGPGRLKVWIRRFDAAMASTTVYFPISILGFLWARRFFQSKIVGPDLYFLIRHTGMLCREARIARHCWNVTMEAFE